MNRRITSLLGAVLLALASVLPVAAWQEATPESGLADLGLPSLEVTVTTTAFEGIPEQLEAGRYLLTVTAEADTDFGGGIGFVQPAGMSAEEFLGMASGPPEDSGAMASPAAADSTPVAGGEEMGGPPPFMFEATYAGGAFAMAGQSAEAVLDLTPGEWIAWGDDPEASQEPVIFEVTGEMPADLPEPASSATLTMAEYSIAVTEGELTAGTQIVKIENVGAQPHFIFVAKGPDDMTAEQIQVVLDEEQAVGMSGTPPAYSGLNPEEDLMPVAFSPTQSMGTAVWMPMTLEPGTYGMVCFFPDLGDGLPHAYHGMYAVVEVAE